MSSADFSSHPFHECHSCGKKITWRFAICTSCEKVYGSSALEWPLWLRWSWNETQRQRRAYRKALSHEIDFTDLEVIESDDESK